MAMFEKTKAKKITHDKKELNGIVTDAIHAMATVVGATLGPGGRPVLIERDGMTPIATKDGVTVAKSLGMAEAEANIIVESAKDICIQTAKQAGDGTTTAIILADALIQKGQVFLGQNPKYNPQRFVNDLNAAYDKVILPYLKQHAVQVNTEEQLRQVAEISANGDKKIAELVVQAIMAAGDDGQVLIEEAQGSQMRVETTDGYIVTSGLKELGHIGPIFINDRSNQAVKMDNAIVFLYDGSMNDLQVPGMIQKALEGSDFYGNPIIVMAHDFSDTVKDAFAKTAKGGVSVAPIKTPMSGLPNSRSMFLQDMSAYTGATVYDPANINTFLEDEDDGFGHVLHARVDMYESYLVAEPNMERINQRVKELKSIHDIAFSEFDKMHLRAAISKLTGGVSTIFVGGASDLEIKEKKHRVEDAVEAVRSALAEGVIPGGASVQLTLAKLLDSHPERKDSWTVLSEALRHPLSILLHNCGENYEDIAKELNKHLDVKQLPSKVFDANEHAFVEPFKAGIIEPAKVCRVSLGNALSVASLLITLGGIVVVPRDAVLENQLAMSKQAFGDMMAAGGIGE